MTTIFFTMAALEAATQYGARPRAGVTFMRSQTLACWVAGASPAMVR